jgi:Dyp-type peroxidase family
MSTTPADERPDLRDIQGNLVGFNKDHQRFVFLQFGDQQIARGFLADIESEIATAWEVKQFNALFKEIHGRRGGEPGIIESSWTNLALTASALDLLGTPGTDGFPEEFRQGMAARAPQIGDVDQSAPAGWVPPFTPGAVIHALAILAADSPEDLGAAHARLQAACGRCGATELGAVDGNVRPDANRGKEHFGFKDGISQPGIAHITHSSKGGEDIATGEFLIGYPDEDGNISGTPVALPQQGQPGYNPIAPPPAPTPMPDWAHNGSFLVFRRLRQDVRAFNDFIAQQAPPLGLPPELLEAKLVGRWRSGAPVERTRHQHQDPPPVDPSIADPGALADRRINDFDYESHDADGHLVPRAAHIRKAYPRDEQPPGDHEADRHRILRRGIPYGPEFQQGEPAYPGGPTVPDNQDRGLVFVCYQSSISRGFEFIQSQWVNNTDFPQPGDGRDPIISQDSASGEFNLPPQNPRLAIARWVTTTGGEYFFAPSISAIRQLAAGE